MHLIFYENHVSGYYNYKRSGKPYPLNGVRSGPDSIILYSPGHSSTTDPSLEAKLYYNPDNREVNGEWHIKTMTAALSFVGKAKRKKDIAQILPQHYSEQDNQDTTASVGPSTIELLQLQIKTKHTDVDRSINKDLDSFILTAASTDSQYTSIDKWIASVHNKFPKEEKHLSIMTHVVTNTTGLLCVSISRDIQSNQLAHPDSYTYLRNYDTKTGKAILLSDIISSEPGATDSIETEIARLLPFIDNETKNTHQLPKNFALVPNGIYFLYNTYEIAPRSVGPIGQFIPFVGHEKWLNQKYLNQFFPKIFPLKKKATL